MIVNMRLTATILRRMIKKTLNEFHSPSGSLRRPASKSSGKTQYHIGKIEDQNKELSSFEAEEIFPGSVEAWVEIVPELWPNAPVMLDPISIKRGTLFFKEGNTLTAAFQSMPQIQLAKWDANKQDWIENDFTNQEF